MSPQDREKDTDRAFLPVQDLSRRDFLVRCAATTAGLYALAQSTATAPARAQSLTSGVGGHGFRLSATSEGRLRLPFWSDAAHWDNPHYYLSMQAGRRTTAKTYTFCDLDGDGREEMFIRGPGGLDIQKWNVANAIWMPLPGDHSLLDNEFHDANMHGFQYNFTLQAADIDGDHQAEIVARFVDGIHVYKYNTAQQNWTRLNGFNAWSDANGWGSAPAYYQTIQFANVLGKGNGQLIGRGTSYLEIFWYLGPDWPPGWLPVFAYDRFSDGPTGFNTADSYWSTIQYADVDHDGADEIIARSGDGLEIHKWDVAAQDFNRIAFYTGWSDGNNWYQPAQYSTIQCADVDGDGAAEILGNGIAGLETFKYNPATKSVELIAPFLDDTSAQYGWTQAQQYASIQFADIDGDGAREMIARAGWPGILAYKYDQSARKWVGLPASDINQELSDGNGYDAVQYYSTFQSAAVLLPGDPDYTGDGTHAQSVIIVRSSSCVLTYRWDVPGQKWVFCQRFNPDFAGTQEAAYGALNHYLLGVGTTNTIRSKYNDLTAPLGTWAAILYNAPPGVSFEAPPLTPSLAVPANIPADAWKAVCWQIYWEMQWVNAVNDWFSRTENLLTQTFLGKDLTLQTVGNYLSIDASSPLSVALNIVSIIGNMAWAVLGLEGLGTNTASAIAGIIGVAAGAAASFAPGSGGTYSGAYSGLQNALTEGFNAAVTQNTTIRNDITGGRGTSGGYQPADYALLKMFGENIY